MAMDGHELKVRVTDELTLHGGTWRDSVTPFNQPIIAITPPPVPMFLQIVDYLEQLAVPRDDFVRLADETRALVSLCIRFGSYFALLADESPPLSPTTHDASISQIYDEEMARMNIEISAALEWWLTLKGSDKDQYYSLIRRALNHLPLGRKTVSSSLMGNDLANRASRAFAKILGVSWTPQPLEEYLRMAKHHPIRVIANAVTLHAWRNGPIENVHAGFDEGYGVNECRVLPRDVRAVVRQAQDVICKALHGIEYLIFDNAWPPPWERLLPFTTPFTYPKGWSCVERSREIQLPIRGHVHRVG